MTTKNQTRDSSMSAITTVEFERPTLPSETYLSELGDDGPPFKVSGVALGAGDVTKGKSGIKKKWPADELKEAADTLQGTSLVVNHENTAQGVVGQVTKAGYKDGTGVIYEAELYDEDLAEKVRDGLLEVSVRGLHADVDALEEDDDSGAIMVEDIEFKNLSIVPSGAAPSNTLAMGEHAELSAAELSAFTETLEASSDAGKGLDSEQRSLSALETEIEPGMWVEGDGIKGITISQVQDGEIEVDIYEEQDGQWRSTEETKMVSTDSLNEWDVDEDDIGAVEDEDEDEEDSDEEKDEEENAEVSEGDYVSWEASGGRAFGRVEEVRTDEDITNDEIKGEGGPITASDDEPAVLIEVWQDGEASGTMVGHKMSTVNVIEKSTVEEEASAITRGEFVKWKDMDNSWRYGQVISVEQEMDQFVATLRRFTESGDKLDETEQKPVQGLDKWDDAPQPSDDVESTETADSGSDDDAVDPMEFEEGQMVEWQANSNMFGKIVHIDQREGKIMVEVMQETGDGVTTTNQTVSAGFSDLIPRDEAEMGTTTKDVPTEDAEPDHEPMGDDDMPMLGEVTLKELLERVDELALRTEGEEIVLDNPTVVANMKWNSPERFTRDQINTDNLDVDAAITPTADLEETYDDYPEAASENAQMALDAREETGNPNDCGTDVGWKRANQLANGESLTREQVGKMSAFARHKGNSDMDDDEGKADCGWMMWKAWGGDEGVEWAQSKLEEIEEEASADEGIDVTELSDVEELQDYEMHEPSWDGTTEQDWSTPDMEDFDTDDLSEIADHFIISSSGFPPENFGDLKLPIVEPSGELNVNALAAVKGGRGASAVEGLSSDMEDEIISMVNSLANEHFDRDWGKEEEMADDVSVPEDHQFSSKEDAMSFIEDMDGVSDVHEMEIDGETVWVPGADHEEYVDVVASASKHGDSDDEEMADQHSIEGTSGEPTASTTVGGVRVLPGDDLRQAYNGESAADSAELSKVTTMTSEKIEEKLSELDEPVAVEAEELQELQDKADRFEELSENIEALRERTEILDEVNREQVEELAESDDAVVVESARYEELQDEAEQVKSVYAASLAEHTPGFTAEELADAHDIDTLRDKHEDVVGELEEELSADTSEEAEPRSTDPSEEELEEASDEQSEEELSDEEELAEEKRQEIKDKIFSER